MVVDFQHHYTPPELMERGEGSGHIRLDKNGNPNYRFNPLLADLSAHVRMMDKAGIDVAVLSCGSGFDRPDVSTCRLINDRMHQAEQDHPGRFIGDDEEVVAYVNAVRALGLEAQTVLDGINAKRLIPNLTEPLMTCGCYHKPS